LINCADDLKYANVRELFNRLGVDNVIQNLLW